MSFLKNLVVILEMAILEWFEWKHNQGTLGVNNNNFDFWWYHIFRVKGMCWWAIGNKLNWL